MSISYRVGSDASGWSSVRNFSTLPSNAGSTARPLRLIHIGDMGWGDKSNDTIARVGTLIAAGSVDGILHTGDVSYADGQQHSWDVFMRKVEAITSSTFYMVTPGAWVGGEGGWGDAPVVRAPLSSYPPPPHTHRQPRAGVVGGCALSRALAHATCPGCVRGTPTPIRDGEPVILCPQLGWYWAFFLHPCPTRVHD